MKKFKQWFEERDPEFEDPGGRSALRKSSRKNPKIYPCPTCGRENMLTLKGELP